MILFLAGWLLTATSADPLQAAQTALARGDYAMAETLANQSAQPPYRGVAMNIVGLARFRAGHPAEGLSALDAAGQDADPPPEATWHYNRAACLYELGRFAESEQEYLRAAGLDAKLRLVSLVNAGFAALDSGSTSRAVELARQAHAEATGPTLDLVRDLEEYIAAASDGHASAGVAAEASAEYRAGLAAFDERRFSEALAHFRAAEQQDPADGRAHIMVGAAALRLGDRDEARKELASALALPLDAADAQIADDYIASMSHGLAALGRGFHLGARVGIGFDTNYLQSGAVDFGTAASPPAAVPVATVTLAGSWRARPRSWVFTEVSYVLDQYAYVDSTASDYSTQQHALTGLMELSLREHLRLGLSATAAMDFVGLSGFRTLELGGGAGAWVELDEHDATTTRIGGEWRHEVAPRSEFAYLTGDRVDATIGQSLRLGPTTAELSYRYRSEDIGTLTEAAALRTPPELCGMGCAESFVIPFGYTSHTLGASVRATVATIVHLGLAGGIEWRTYAADSSLMLVPMPGAPTLSIDSRLRQDTRVFGSAFVDARVWRGLDLSLRYDLVVNQSNVDDQIVQGMGVCGPPGFVCHQFDYDNKNYTKHVLLFETAYEW